jgi:rod shape-determining protein MreD
MAKAATPTVVGVVGVVLLSLPVRLLGGLIPTPMLPLLVVYFWAIFGPGYMPAYSVFLIGLLQDFLTGGPLGLWPAVYLFTQYVVSSQRSYFQGREMRVVWVGFAFAALAAAVIVWLVMSLMSGAVLPIDGLLAQTAVTIVAYPFFAKLFGSVHRRMILET